MTNNILLIRVPSQEAVNGRDLRDYILESLARGVLVLTEDASCEVMELPPLGGVEVIQAAQISPITDQDPLITDQNHSITDQATQITNQPDPEKLPSAEAVEKQAVLQRLQNFRAAHGLGSLSTVAKATRTRGKINDNTLRMILTGDIQLPIEDWRKIGRALDRLEAKEQGDAENEKKGC